jgi:hypothetical protein
MYCSNLFRAYYLRTENSNMDTIKNGKESFAHVVWAAHILSYLTKRRSQTGLVRTTDLGDEADNQEYDGQDVDFKTETATALSSPIDALRQKFLDCLAELLSPSKGWDDVTSTALREYEDRVEIDVARNAGFDVPVSPTMAGDVEVKKDEEYLRSVEEYLSSQSATSALN